MSDNAWLAWVIVALVLAGVEIMTLDLIFIMLAAGALAGALGAGLGLALWAQLLVGGLSALAMLLVVRPVALRHLRTPHEVRTGIAALVGSQAVVLERVDALTGRVKLAGEVWSARSYDPHAAIEPGRTVDVVQIEGATAIVLAAD
ncbi:NfeD family protein [Vallicoccus soli]|uniref:NfeD family protein n=1 Tax=Vallicoccus soli TaxID=2339232 RepID=A0A3A3YT62_9ACTN|nr:NfeD family protein [Vallicoccus soli]